jgi:endoglucanase
MTESLQDQLRTDITALAGLHGPSGREQAVVAALQERLTPLAQSIRVDQMGNLLAECGGPAEAPLVLLDAHTDEIGCLVRSIEPEGFLRIYKVGGILDSLLVGRKVSVNGLRGVIGVKAGHLQSPEEQHTVVPVKELYVDLGLASAEEVNQAGIAVGDPVTYVSEVEPLANPSRLCGKAIDDRVGCAILLHALGQLAKEQLPVRVAAQFTVQEETGLRGAGPAAFNFAPHLAIAIDTVPCGDTPDVRFHTELPIALGRGPVLQAASGSAYGGMITPQAVLSFAIRTAEKIGIPYQEAILEGGSTNATAIHYSRSGVPAIAVTIPRRYSHSPIEVVDLNDVAATLQLVVAMTQQAGHEDLAFLP